MTMKEFKKYLEIAIKTKEETIEMINSYHSKGDITNTILNEEKIRLQELKDIRKVINL